jgi:hypothetical protein
MAQDMAERTVNRATPPRTPDQIEADLERTRAELSRTVDQIADRVAPRNIARRALASVKAQVVDGNGQLRIGRVVVAAAGVTAFIAFTAWRRRR